MYPYLLSTSCSCCSEQEIVASHKHKSTTNRANMYPLSERKTPQQNDQRHSLPPTYKRKAMHRNSPNTGSFRIRRPEADDQEEEATKQPRLPTRYQVCQCCYDEIRAIRTTNTVDSKYTCNTGKHKFCHDCVKQYIETWVYAESYPLRDTPEQTKALPCLASSQCSDCFLSTSLVERVCAAKVWEAYQEKMFRIMSVGNWKADYSDSCDTFGTESSYSDDDDDDDDEDKTVVAANKLNEALTEAKLRRCPDCFTPFLKETGCNKIPCPSCHTVICYICSERVPRKGYEHFCNHSYDNCSRHCGKCPLWTTQDEHADQQRLIALTNHANQAWERALLGQPPSTL